jgi:hypothetical protein
LRRTFPSRTASVAATCDSEEREGDSVNTAYIEEWRQYVARHKLRVAIIGGLVATHVTTNLGMWYHGVFGLPDLNFNYLNGLLIFGNSAQAATGMQDPVMLTAFGAFAHYSQGLSFSLLYAFAIYPMIPIASTLYGNIVKGVIWGVALATLSSVWWINLFPNLFGPGKSAGVFFANAGPDMWKWLIAVYLWHIVYGFTLGSFFNPAPLRAGAAAAA